MPRGRFLSTCIFILLVIPASSQSLDGAIANYWTSHTEPEKAEAIKKMVRLNPSFDSLYMKLKEGRLYSPNVKRGFVTWDRNTSNGIKLFALIYIPLDYNPEKKWPVRVVLHGGISSLDPYNVLHFIDTSNADYKSVEQIRIYPSAYFAARWYYDLQYKNVMQLLDSVKEIYNVNENSVSLTGFSDGATGTYAFANFNPTPYCCFLPFIGSSAGLKFLGQRQVYFLNYINKPFFIVNGNLDQTFPPSVVQPYVDQIERLNKNVMFYMLDTFGHTLKWLPLLQDTIDHFILNHARNPYPDHLIWETENPDDYNRNHWVIINSLGETKHNSADLVDENLVMINGAVQEAFKRDSAFGIIDVKQEGNIVTVKTKGVKSFTVLLSPDQFDFNQEIIIYTNGILSFKGNPEKNISTLLQWNDIDNDRTMLFAAELHIKTDKEFKIK